MRYGIFSDVHSNLEAMTVVAQAMKSDGAEDYLCLGDFVGYYSNPNEVIELIDSLHCWKMVLGNHDAALLGKTPLSKFNAPAAEAINWTKTRIKPQHLHFLESLRLREEIGDIQLVHSSPYQSEEWHYLTGQEDLERNFRYFQGLICFFGHVHKPFIAEQKKDGSVRILPETDYQLQKDCRYLVNVGSVGQPRDGSPQTCYVMYDTSSQKLSIRRIDYDYETTVKKTLDAGLPEYLAQRLKTGK
ncbi:MAG TPA: metallophosphoesterase family protein [bacterium]|jgi:predicted phosphodiesterase|nr:metallophosphoesterase family protein [bacterium]